MNDFYQFSKFVFKRTHGKKGRIWIMIKKLRKKKNEKSAVFWKKWKKNEMNGCMHGLNDVHQIKKKGIELKTGERIVADFFCGSISGILISK